MLLLVNRAWQKKLNALVNDPQQKAELYACLWVMMHEETSDNFKERERVFVSYWKDKQPSFVQYYQQEYSSRPG